MGNDAMTRKMKEERSKMKNRACGRHYKIKPEGRPTFISHLSSFIIIYRDSGITAIPCQKSSR